MEKTKPIETNAKTCCAPASKRGWLSSRNVLIGTAILGGSAALFFGWDWLAAAGFASVIVGALPCLLMCAAGLCMGRMGKNQSTDASGSIPQKQTDLQASVTSANAEPGTVPAMAENQDRQPAKRAA